MQRRRVAFVDAAVTARKSFNAFPSATTLGRFPGEIIRRGDFDHVCWMPRTLQWERWAYVAVTLENVDNLLPHLDWTVARRVTDQIHTMTCSTKKDIYTVAGAKETASLITIAPDERDDNDLRLLALEVVHSCHPERLQERSTMDSRCTYGFFVLDVKSLLL